tara:strand:+ start:1367 stop:3538 length:2172 start_codon:yes stop_codon:yes gene_type:complete
MEWDTLDDVRLTETATLVDVYHAVLGKAMQHADLVGVVTTGKIEITHHHGNGSWGKSNVSYPPHPEIWQVRSKPKGTIGKPIEPTEIREVIVLIRKGTEKAATIATIKLWRLPNVLNKLDFTKAHYDRGKTTYGALGVAFHGIGIFSRRTAYKSEDGKIYNVAKNCNCHSVLSSFSTILNSQSTHICRVEASQIPHNVIAAHLAGFYVNDVPLMRACEERFEEGEWNRMTCTHVQQFVRQLDEEKAGSKHATPDLPAVYLFSAECVFEQASFIWLLDAMSDKFYEDALADDLHQPCKISLILAIAVRMACSPTRWDMSETAGDDAYATKMAALLFEAVQPSLLTTCSDGRSTRQTFAIDIAITHACEATRAAIQILRNGETGSEPAATRIDAEESELMYKQTLQYLFCAGVAICHDTCGLVHNCGDNSSGLHTNMGLAAWDADPCTESAAQSAYAYGLGNVSTRVPTHRTSTRGKRQKALLRVLQNVEEWICTGKYRGILIGQNQMAQCDSGLVENIRVDDLQVGRAVAAPVADATSSTATTTSTPARHVRLRNKKGQRNASTKDVNASLANKGRRRVAHDRICIDNAIGSLLKTNEQLTKQSTSNLGQKMSGGALDEAYGVMSDLLQVGAVFGIGQYFDYKTYVVGPISHTRCATCPRQVDVVASVAFSGFFGSCKRCSHPRCLHCVSEDIDLVAMNCGQDPLLAEPTSAQLGACLGCFQTA